MLACAWSASLIRALSSRPINRNTPDSSRNEIVRQFTRSASRSLARTKRGSSRLPTSPAVTTASTPEAPAASAGRNATNGTTKETAVVCTGSANAPRISTASRPTASPITSATATA
jgi:hypothetical protein